MARVHPGNLNFQVPDHDDQQLRNQDFERKARVTSIARSGASGRGAGGRGGRGGEHVRCCYKCGEPGHIARECFPSNSGRSSNNVDVRSLLAYIEQKEKQLKQFGQENEILKGRLSEATSEISSSRAEKEEVILKKDLLEEDLEKCKNNLSLAKDKEEEMTRKWCLVKEELEDTKGKLKEKLKEVEEAKEAAEAEMKKLKLETVQWRKAAKAVAAVFAGGEEICSKTPELESLVLYYSSRATKRMSLGKMREAIADCRMAAGLDPNFLKAFLTAGNCHLLLGEIDDAMYNYRKCLESGMIFLDRRLTIEASDGLQNAQKVDNYVRQSAKLLQQKTFESATAALEVITEALLISCYSEKLLEMKGEALFMLRKYEKVIQMCEENFSFAMKNCDGNHMSDGKKALKLWRCSLMSRVYFRLGRLETALTLIEKQEQLTSTETKVQGSCISLASTVRELLRCKRAGNEAYQAGKHREALEHYSNALLRGIESRPFTAVCLCNRAAAHQALGEVTDAIADCNLAIAFDGSYLKAISRRANLYEKIRDYEQAALDLRTLIPLLERQCEEKSTSFGAEELSVARRRLSSVERNLKKDISLDLYLILGLKKGSTSDSEIKKAYRKAALSHHPDKAGKFLARCESGSDSHIWEDIVVTVHKDADKLFKMIGEAYAVLSDPDKRFKYNLEEACR